MAKGTQPHSDKFGGESYSIGLAKHIPRSSVNLAYISSPEITDDNVSIVNEVINVNPNVNSYEVYYSNATDGYIMENSNKNTAIPSQDIIVTDEFSVKKTTNSTPLPLFYKATLSKEIKGTQHILSWSTPYQYGYTDKTEEMVRADSDSTDKTDIMPLVHILDIRTADGVPVLDGFKIRMIQGTGNRYLVEIYNNFTRNIVYKVTYKEYSGAIVTEVLESHLIFSKIPYEDFVVSVQDPNYLEAKEYAIRQQNGIYNVYAPTQMMSIDDNMRKPFEFKYRVLANLQGNYNKSNPVEANVGILFLDQNVSADVHGILATFTQEVGGVFPDYLTFKNPHPPLEYIGMTGDNLKTPHYWDVELNGPQDHINDYDIIFIVGYGAHDLSAYNAKLKAYLEDGGKVVIDNSSNVEIDLLNITFGENPIVNYMFSVPGVVGDKEFSMTGYNNRYYNIDEAMIATIPFTYEDESQVSPMLTTVNEDANAWSDIIRLKSGSKSIALKTFNGRGKILLSSCGLIKGFLFNTDDSAKKLMTNILFTLVEDIWKTTPWIYDRVYHKDQLYQQEYDFENYVSDVDPLSSNTQIISKKIIASRIKDFTSYYTGIYGLPGTYYIQAYERDNRNDFVPLVSVYLPPVLSGDSALYAYARRVTNSNFDIDDVDGYERSDININYTPVTFKVAITPFTFRWVDSNGTVVQEIVEAPLENRIKIPYIINRANGFVNLGLLSTLVPQLPSGNDWADKSKVFFRLEVSGDEEVVGEFVDPYENRVNINLYDKFTGKYIYSSDGAHIISHDDIYRWRQIGKTDSGGIMKESYEDIIVQASTNYYLLVANKRIFAIEQHANSITNAVEIPSNLNTNEAWFPRVKHLHFIKNAFNKDDYDRISRTIGFKFDKDFLLTKAAEYFSVDLENIPTLSDDPVINVIRRLDADDTTVNTDDISLLAAAFDLIDEGNSYEYDTIEYYTQAWPDGMPLKRITNECAKYLNSTTISVQYSPLNVQLGCNTDETLLRLSPTIYKASRTNWLQSYPLVIDGTDYKPCIIKKNGILVDIEDYIVDYINGLIFFDTPPDVGDVITATYNYSNIKIVRKSYVSSSVGMEQLQMLQERMYMVGDAINKEILTAPSPRLYVKYTDGQTELLAPSLYSINYETGIVTTVNQLTGALYMSYSYQNTEYIELKNYNSTNGIIELMTGIHFNDSVYVSYYYEEEYYEYKGYYNKELDKFMYIDMNPTRGHECTYSVVNGTTVTYKEIPTYQLLGKTLYIYMLPYKTIRTTKTTTLDTTLKHTFDKDELALLQIAHPELIILGSIKLINNYTVYDVITLDTRQRGGGLKESLSNEQIERHDEASLNLWDINPFDGHSYHPNGITIIKLPKKVLVEHGGRFTNEEVGKIVEQHLALGIMPIIKYY